MNKKNLFKFQLKINNKKSELNNIYKYLVKYNVY